MPAQKNRLNVGYFPFSKRPPTASLEKNSNLAEALGLTGTPGIIVMPVSGATPDTITVFPEAVTAEKLQAAIRKATRVKCSSVRRTSPARDCFSCSARKCHLPVPFSCASSIRPAGLILRRALPVKRPFRTISTQTMNANLA